MSGASAIATVFKGKYLVSLRGKMMNFREIIADIRSHPMGKNDHPPCSRFIPEVSDKAVSSAAEKHFSPIDR